MNTRRRLAFTTIILVTMLVLSSLAATILYLKNQEIIQTKEKLEERVAILETQVENLSKNINKWKLEYNSLVKNCATLKSNFSKLKEEKLSLSSKYTNLKQKYNNLLTRIETLARELNETKKELQVYKNILYKIKNPKIMDYSNGLLNISVKVKIMDDGTHYNISIKNISNSNKKVFLMMYYNLPNQFFTEPYVALKDIKPSYSYSKEILLRDIIPYKVTLIVGIPSKLSNHIYLLHDPSIQVENVQITSKEVILKIRNTTDRSFDFNEYSFYFYNNEYRGFSGSSGGLEPHSTQKVDFDIPSNQDMVIVLFFSQH